jgi:hypothetical protein
VSPLLVFKIWSPWANVASDDVWRLLLILPLVFFLLLGWLITSALKMETARLSETLASTSQSTRRLNRKEHHRKTTLFVRASFFLRYKKSKKINALLLIPSTS